jgi:hypothetical protein
VQPFFFSFFFQCSTQLINDDSFSWAPRGKATFLKAKVNYKKHALYGKARTTALHDTGLGSSQVEVPNGLTTRVGAQGCMTRSSNGNGVTKVVENATSPQARRIQAERLYQIVAINAVKPLPACVAPLQSTSSLDICDELNESIDDDSF